jgi:hypothetical protein
MRNNNSIGYDLLSDFKFYSNYSKFNNETNRSESWSESVDRVFNEMHEIKFKETLESNKKFREYYEFAKLKYKEKFVLASQRSLQFGGAPILKHNSKMFNCLSAYCDRPKFFQEAMYWLLSGCGVGFSVQKNHIKKLPKIKARSNRSKVFVVEDSIEGWSDAIGVLLSSYLDTDVPFIKYHNCYVSFDYSNIRPKGSYISGGFKAPGHEGLRNSINKIEELLEKELDKPNFDGTIESIVAYDIVMHLSDAVLSGGVRRSATICLFSPDDEKMLKAKTGNWYVDNPQRARSNNTVCLNRNTVTKEEFHKFFESIKEYGEPGFGFVENEDIAYNPCFEIGMKPQTETGISGWQGCVSYNTKLITKSGIEEIGEVVENNKEIEIWNGSKWCNVKPIKTGINRELFRVKFSDGSYLDCTENHKFMIKNRFQKDFYEIETSKIIDLLNESKYDLQIPNSNVIYDNSSNNVEYAYEYGFILGDGTVGTRLNGKNRVPFAEIYDGSKDDTLGLRGKIGNISINENNIEFKRIYFNDVDCNFLSELKYSFGLPKEIFTWSRDSIINFIAGWIDADGSKTTNGCRIYGKEDKLRDCQLLLTKLGIKSSINLASKKGFVTNFATRKYDLWYIQISDTKDLYSNRMKLKSTPIKGKGKNQLIKSITKLEGLYNSYCFEEPETHNGLFGNVLTKQCNLCEINGGKCDTEELFYDACKAAAIIGTMQAAYTDFKYVGAETKEIFDREALIGCSITGFMNNPEILLNPEIQKKGANLIKKINKEVAKMIGIRQAARTTCVKPSGNASVLLSTASGIHGEHAPRFIRNVQVNKEDDIAKYFKEINPKMVEDSVWSSNNTDWVISFPIEPNENSIFKDELNGVNLLTYVKLTQQNWVEEGTNIELCTDPKLRHNVSNTIQVDDWDEVENYLFENREFFAGVSLLSMTGDKDYNQAPFTAIYTPKELVEKYGDAAMFASGLIVDGLNAFNNNLWVACDTVIGLGEKLEFSDKEVSDKLKTLSPKESWEMLGFKNGTLDALAKLYIKPEIEEFKRYMDSKLNGSVHNYPLKRDWIRRAKQFSDRYFTSYKEMAYCLKDVHNYHKWVEINREVNQIDWNEINIKPKFTDIDTLGSISCAGGACEIV